MNPSDKTMVRFYRQLGKLFYGIASVDKNVREDEITKLKEIIKSEWLPLENTHDIFGSDSAYQIEIVFDWLMENDFEMDQTLINLDLFKQEHSSLFTPTVNELILKTANAIAKSFARENKSEHVLISRISELLSS
jgi:uncharacterized tellurite resistance protein B-like protein